MNWKTIKPFYLFILEINSHKAGASKLQMAFLIDHTLISPNLWYGRYNRQPLS